MHTILPEVKRVNDILDCYELPSGEDDCSIKIEEISEIRNRLIERGFNKTFISSYSVPKIASREEKRDIRRQIRDMRYVNYLKKSTLKRLDYAMASYKIALLHFRSGALPEAYNYLPYDGNIVGRITKTGAIGARLYFDLYELVSGEVQQIGISLDVAVPEEGGVGYERLQLYGVRNVDDYINNLYGEDVEVIRTRIIRKHRSFLTSKSYRKALACAYAANTAMDNSFEPMDSEGLEEYVGLLKKYGICELVRIDGLNSIDERLIDELAKKELIKFSGGKLCLADDLAAKLNEKMSRRYWEYLKKAYGKVVLDLIRLIMLTTKNVRRMLGVFSFDDDVELLKPVIEKAGLKGIVNAQKMIDDKLRIDESVGFGSRKIGLAVFAYYQGSKRLKEVFNTDMKEIGEECKMVRSYIEEKGKGGEFLEHLKK